MWQSRSPSVATTTLGTFGTGACSTGRRTLAIGRSRVPIARVLLVAVIVAGTPALAGDNILIGVEPDTCYTVTVDGASIPGDHAADSLGILEFAVIETLPASRQTVTFASGCDTIDFVVCPGECGVRPQGG